MHESGLETHLTFTAQIDWLHFQEWPVRFDQISSRVLIVHNSDFGPVI